MFVRFRNEYGTVFALNTDKIIEFQESTTPLIDIEGPLCVITLDGGMPRYVEGTLDEVIQMINGELTI